MRSAAVLLAVLGLATAAPAAEAPTGWGGENPFACELQPAGFEATGNDPAADPYCVEFDKTRQNVTELGVLEFLSKEPARVAAAVPKCFYFQSDHWRGSFVQDDGTTKTYEWDGHYFFDKATGDGGAWVTNFNINGRTADPSQIPGIPPEYARHLGPGTGGVVTRNAVEADPACVVRAREEPEQIYARDPRPRCAKPSGRSLPVALGETDAAVRKRLGPPGAVRRGFLRYCLEGGGTLAVGQPGDRSGEMGSDPAALTVAVWTDAKRLLPRRARGRRALRIGTTVIRRSGTRYVGVRRGRVRWVARVKAPSRRAARSLLRRAASG